MPKYQIQYKHQSHTYVSDMEADSKDSVYALFREISTAEILEIRKYIYESNKYVKDDGNYNNALKFSLFDDHGHSRVFLIKKLKKNKTPSFFISAIRSLLKFHSKSNFSVRILGNY